MQNILIIFFICTTIISSGLVFGTITGNEFTKIFVKLTGLIILLVSFYYWYCLLTNKPFICG